MKKDTLKKKALGITALALVVAISTQGCMRNTQTEETTPENAHESLQTEISEETEEDTAQAETQPTVQAVKSEEVETEAETEEADLTFLDYYNKCDRKTVDNYKLQYQLEYLQDENHIEEGTTIDEKTLYLIYTTVYYMNKLGDLLGTERTEDESAMTRLCKYKAYIELINELGYVEYIIKEDGTLEHHLTELGESINAVYGGN